MKRFKYNSLKFARIKSTVFGMLVIIQGLTIILTFSGRVNILVGTTTLLPLIVFYLIYRFSLGQMLELLDNEKFETYTAFGTLRWNVKKYEALESATIEQSNDRFYCLTLNHSRGQKLILEKHPTLDKAQERMTELKNILG